MVSEISGISFGFLSAAAYVHYGWYYRQVSPDDWHKHVKIRGLAWLAGENVALAVLAKQLSAVAFYYAIAASLGFSVVFIALVIITCGVIGFYSNLQYNRQISGFLQYSMLGFFQGPQTIERSIQEKSKLALSEMTILVQGYVDYAEKCDRSPVEFQKCFKVLAGMLLYMFFQHGDGTEHADYCASYLKWNEQTHRFDIIAYISGSSRFHFNNTSLGPDSVAYHAMQCGVTVSWPTCEKEEEIKPQPPIKNRAKRFICVPVPESTNSPNHVGVLCVDSAKDGMNFDDDFHKNLLRWFAILLKHLDNKILTAGPNHG
jgi:hypothetical protein